MNREYPLTVAALVAAMIIWASSFIALKIAFSGYNPLFVIWGRLVIAAICFLFCLKVFRRNRYRRGDLKYLLLMAFFEPCLYFICEAKALENTSASQAGVITAMLPLLVAVAARFTLKEMISRRTLAGFIIAIIGAAWLSIGGHTTANAPNPAFGNFMEFLAMCCATGYTIAVKRLSSRYDPFALTAIQAFVGSIFFLPLAYLSTGGIFPNHYHPAAFWSIIYLGVFVSLGAYGLYNFGISRIPANQASAFINLIPALTLLMGWFILNERLTASQLTACILVFLGVFLSQDRRSRPRKDDIAGINL